MIKMEFISMKNPTLLLTAVAYSFDVPENH